MNRVLEKLKIIAVASVALIGISACGGGSGGDSIDNNNAPIANDDVAISTNGNTVVINVLDNDTSRDGNSLTISTITRSPERGTAVIASNGTTIEYTPNDGYLGFDDLTYTVSDDSLDNLLSGEATVELTVNQTMTLSGNVTDSLVAGSQVIATVGDDTFETVTDDEGLYNLEITSSDVEAMISLRAYGSAANNQASVELVSIVEDFSGLIEADDGDNNLTATELQALNVTQLSTALFLMAKDINADQSFIDFSRYELMLEQVDIDEVLHTTGVIKLLIDDVTYNELLTENLLTLLDSAEGELTDLAIDDIANRAAENGIEESVFMADIETAIDQTLAAPHMTQPFTSDMLVNKRIVQTEGVRANWIAPYGRVMDFAEDGTFTLYAPSSSNIKPFEIALTATGMWTINGSSVDMDYFNTLKTAFIVEPIISELYEKFGEDVASAYSMLEDIYFFQTPGTLAEADRNLHLIVKTKTTMKVRVDISITETIQLPQPIMDILNDGRTEVSYVNQTSTGYDLISDPSSQLTGLTGVNIQNDWVLFMPLSFAPETFIDMTGETTDFLNFSSSFNEKITFNVDGTTSTRFTDAAFNWSFDNGKIILTHDNDRLEYTPYYQVNKEWLAIMEYYQGDQLIDVYVDEIAQFDDTYSVFINNLTTELPMAYLTNATSYISSNWQGGLRTEESLFGFQFNDDGSVIYGISVYEDVDIDGEENLSFRGNTFSWDWFVNDRQVVLNNTDDIFDFYQRYIDVLSVDSLGRVLVFEYSILDIDDNRLILQPPRLNILTLENLEQWPQAWENNSIQ